MSQKNMPTIFKEIITHDKEMDKLRQEICNADAVSIDVGKLIRSKRKQRQVMSGLAAVTCRASK